MKTTLEILESASRIAIGEFGIYADGELVSCTDYDLADLLRTTGEPPARRLPTAGEAIRQIIEERAEHRNVVSMYASALNGDEEAKKLCRLHQLRQITTEEITRFVDKKHEMRSA